MGRIKLSIQISCYFLNLRFLNQRDLNDELKRLKHSGLKSTCFAYCKLFCKNVAVVQNTVEHKLFYGR